MEGQINYLQNMIYLYCKDIELVLNTLDLLHLRKNLKTYQIFMGHVDL